MLALRGDQMVMKILVLIFFVEIKESKITRGHSFNLVNKQSRWDVRTFSLSQRTINVWNKLVALCYRFIMMYPIPRE